MEKKMIYKGILQKICIAFVAALLALTFFSQTLADLRTAQVTTTFMEPGVISPVENTSAIIEPANIQTIFAPIDGVITQIAGAGENVGANQPLFTIHGDLRNLQSSLEQARDDVRLVALNVERVNSERAAVLRQISQLQADSETGPELLEYELQLVAIDNRIALAQRDLEAQESLFEQGLVPGQTLTERQNALELLFLDRDHILARMQLAEDLQAEALEEQQQAERVKLEEYQTAINQLDIQLRIHAAEAESAQRRINELLAQMEGGGILETLADGNMAVWEALPGIAEGAKVAEGTPIMVIARRDNQFVLNIPLSRSITFLREGSAATITVGEDNHNATISRIFSERGQRTAVVNVTNTGFSGGEWAEVRLHGDSMNYRRVIPRSALRIDPTGYYMLAMSAEERLFGFTYYANFIRIDTVTARDERFVAVVLQYWDDEENMPIIVNSDMPISPDERVRPVDGGVFVDTR
jgi:biotin carboxyl carrier protein